MIFISDVVLYLLSEGWKKSLIFDGTISFQDLKMAVFMQDTTFSESGSDIGNNIRVISNRKYWYTRYINPF